MRRLLGKLGLEPNGRLGQHFLVDSAVVSKIIEAAEPCKEDLVLEVGPGLGALTFPLADRANFVTAVEIDPLLSNACRQLARDLGNVEIINADVLKLNLQSLIRSRLEACNATSFKVVSSLPYYITGPFLSQVFHNTKLFTEKALPLKLMVLIVQREVAQRLTARPGSKLYGSLSVLIDYYSQTFVVKQVSRNCFLPPPEVESSLILLRARERPPVNIPDVEFFFAMVQSIFRYRRKTLLNALSTEFASSFPKKLLEGALDSARINSKRRPETLSLEEFALLCQTIKRLEP